MYLAQRSTPMRSRTHPKEIFSTFLDLAEDSFRGWIIDPKLRRSMNQCLEQVPPSHHQENFWVVYWHKSWQTSPRGLAKGHLSAYLQESSYWAAQKMLPKLAKFDYKLSDCFQITNLYVDRVLKGFKGEGGYSFKNYAGMAFMSVIRDSLRQHKEAQLSTDWALLHNLSPKKLVKSLENAGFTPELIAQYRLAWSCFGALYAPSQTSKTRKLAPPPPETWEAIAQLYNRERHSQLGCGTPPASAQDLEKWLKEIVPHVRRYLSPGVTSLNQTLPGENTVEVIDTLPAGEDSLLGEMIAAYDKEQRQTQRDEVGKVLAAAIGKLKPEIQNILQFYYGQGLTQQQIAQELEMRQNAVSRRLSKAKQSLLKDLAVWSQQKLGVDLNSEVLKHMNRVIHEWLQGYFSQN